MQSAICLLVHTYFQIGDYVDSISYAIEHFSMSMYSNNAIYISAFRVSGSATVTRLLIRVKLIQVIQYTEIFVAVNFRRRLHSICEENTIGYKENYFQGCGAMISHGLLLNPTQLHDSMITV